MHDLEGTTRDLRDLGVPHPAEKGLPKADTEDQARAYGATQRRRGTVILVGTVIVTLGGAVLAEEYTWDSGAAQMLATLAILSITVYAGCLIVLGGIEKMLRPVRTHMRLAMSRATQNAELGGMNAQLIADLVEAQEAMNQRLAAMEKTVAAVPEYEQIFRDGYQFGRSSAGLADLDQLPGVGPNEIDRYRRHN
ncbi:hypothetical protein AMIS_19490 [Actinoplanes missouriensis 431]|uniref:Uncharacterized protein n=1 Tax=Actinoplanes missouriensis (strain ATCC 14538 / DSM 43046 / CBS 188.64 / JCM 3121 / NBRC 102363 / NCIMB 12654 / NRRL B-3342 / UNCC 431) TaxID=512565 RepID=I0H2D2_ACTM4|nr:hypothetical protein [Actinoplanes missouriensis]BAL87169.1 hypothetical protein AMIS_19490 [Actinoplanes missouriensis 431]